MHHKYVMTVAASRIAQLAHDMGLAGNCEDWERVADYAYRISKLAEEAVNAADEAKAKEE